MNIYDDRETVQAFEEAINHRNLPRLLSLADDNIALVGPKGRTSGHDALAAWVMKAGLSLDTQRSFVGKGVVVNAQLGYWHDPNAGEVVSERPVSTLYRVQNRRITYLVRYDELQVALQEGDLSEADEVARPD